MTRKPPATSRRKPFSRPIGHYWRWQPPPETTPSTFTKETDLLSPWLYRIATNRALSLLRSQAAHRRTPQQPPTTGGASLEDTVIGRELLRAALNTLDDDDAACLVMHYVAGERYGEIAARLNLSARRSANGWGARFRPCAEQLRRTGNRGTAMSKYPEATNGASPHLTDELLAAWAADELAGDERGAVQRHLDTCAYCPTALAETRRIRTLARASANRVGAPVASASVVERVLARLPDASTVPPTSSPAQRREGAPCAEDAHCAKSAARCLAQGRRAGRRAAAGRLQRGGCSAGSVVARATIKSTPTPTAGSPGVANTYRGTGRMSFPLRILGE